MAKKINQISLITLVFFPSHFKFKLSQLGFSSFLSFSMGWITTVYKIKDHNLKRGYLVSGRFQW